jgi:putative methyltransferase (TIGR04325 family)
MQRSPGHLASPTWKRAWSKLVRAHPHRNPIYHSYDDALRSCSANGYENDDLVRVVVDKNIAFRDQLEARPALDLGAMRTLFGVGLACTGRCLKVLDLGGGGGFHYFVARTVLGRTIDIRWNVVETPAMAREGARIEDGALKFFADVGEAVTDLGNVDLVLSSGALQYCRDPLASLRELVDARASHMFITRTSFNEGTGTIVSVQQSLLSSNGPGPLPPGHEDRTVRYPIVFASRAKAECLMRESYDIRFVLTEDLGAYSVGATPMHLYGYYCDLRRA